MNKGEFWKSKLNFVVNRMLGMRLKIISEPQFSNLGIDSTILSLLRRSPDTSRSINKTFDYEGNSIQHASLHYTGH